MRILVLLLLGLLPLPALAQDYYDFSTLTMEDATNKPLVMLRPVDLPVAQITAKPLCVHGFRGVASHRAWL